MLSTTLSMNCTVLGGGSRNADTDTKKKKKSGKDAAGKKFGEKKLVQKGVKKNAHISKRNDSIDLKKNLERSLKGGGFARAKGLGGENVKKKKKYGQECEGCMVTGKVNRSKGPSTAHQTPALTSEKSGTGKKNKTEKDHSKRWRPRGATNRRS